MVKLFLFFVLLALPIAAFDRNGPPPAVVPSVDLNRYAGKWYELARYPNRFEKACARNVTAQYALRPDGKISVVNTCTKANGDTKVARGTAKRASKDGPASKLKVTFFWPFSGDYWVLALEPDYRWALVGSPDRDYLWILSRTPTLEASTFQEVVSKAESLGFDESRLVRTPQSKSLNSAASNGL